MAAIWREGGMRKGGLWGFDGAVLVGGILWLRGPNESGDPLGVKLIRGVRGGKGIVGGGD